MISGALYHRVATYSVIIVGFSSGSAPNPRLSPKSHILSSQSAFTKRFPGLRSLWTTEAECMYLIPDGMGPFGHVRSEENVAYLEESGIRSTGRVQRSVLDQT